MNDVSPIVRPLAARKQPIRTPIAELLRIPPLPEGKTP